MVATLLATTKTLECDENQFEYQSINDNELTRHCQDCPVSCTKCLPLDINYQKDTLIWCIACKDGYSLNE